MLREKRVGWMRSKHDIKGWHTDTDERGELMIFEDDRLELNNLYSYDYSIEFWNRQALR